MEAALILASGSPRRRELLSLCGVAFDTDPAQGEEKASGECREMALALARGKCEEVSARHPDKYVLAADTLVCLDGEVMGKPKDARDAVRMLQRLSGRTHQVYTGVCAKAPDGRTLCEADVTDVTFTTLCKSAIERYVASGEPMDKAGAYAIQGGACAFVSRISGSPTNVVGLPMALVGRMLSELGLSIFD